MATTNFTKSLVEEYNIHPELLLLLAWNRFKVAHPTKVKLLTLDSHGFSLEVESKNDIFSKSTKVAHIHVFTPSEMKGSPNDTLDNLIKKYTYPSFPANGFHAVALWFFIGICAFDLPFVDDKLYWVKHVALLVLKSKSIAMITLAAMGGIHVLETAYVMYLLNPIIKEPAVLAAWAGVTLCLGYPSTIRAVKLSSVAQKSKAKKSE
jgi:hypothetical protein